MNYSKIIKKLKSLKNQKNIDGMARFGINPKNTLGISIYDLRKIAKEIGKILASFIDEPDKVTDAQLEKWVLDFDSWDVVDQVSELIAHTPFVAKKIFEWSERSEEFVKRSAFSLIAEVSWWDKKITDKEIEKFFPVIKKAATDERNFVKKAVNWALRNIGKRNKKLNKKAIKVAKEIDKIDDKTSKWIAKDALRELTSDKIQARIK